MYLHNDYIYYSFLFLFHRVLGYSPQYRSGFWHNTALSLFVGLVIVIVAVYTRQQTGFLMPKKKQATD